MTLPINLGRSWKESAQEWGYPVQPINALRIVYLDIFSVFVPPA